jgi:N-acetylglucosaminyldiphosphoundecaprenol N-acetyl-beta-D-mannosaminyltransferase
MHRVGDNGFWIPPDRNFGESVLTFIEQRRRTGVNIDQVWLDGPDLQETIRRITEACESQSTMHIVTANLNFITLARRYPAFRDAINKSDLTVADGRWLLWISRLAGRPAAGQVTGHDIVRECIRLADKRGYRLFLLGGVTGCVEKLSETLKIERTGLQVEACSDVRFHADGLSADNAKLIQRLETFAPNILLVGAGSPKAELWIARNLPSLPPCVVVGIGGVFDTLAGLLPRAPRWMQVAGLEWLFRLLIRPHRYARRYLLEDPPTLFRILGTLLIKRLRSSQST